MAALARDKAGLWTEGVPPCKRAEGAHAAAPVKADATCVQTNAKQSASATQCGLDQKGFLARNRNRSVRR